MKKQDSIWVIFSAILVLAALALVVVAGQPADYAKAENWAYYAEGEDKAVDLFLIAPTVFDGDDKHRNMSLDDAETKEAFLGALNMERGVYESDCRIFAPYYRQAALNVYEQPVGRREAYFQAAERDVKAAFRYYMEHENNGRPFVLAGSFQGADMLLRLMKKEFASDRYADRLVAAYATGWSLTWGEIAAHPQLRAAKGESDTGVIVLFNAEAEGVTASLVVPEKSICINPLNWKTDGTVADASLNKGACFVDDKGNVTEEIPALCGAYVDTERGTLKVTGVTPEDYPPLLPIFEPGVYSLYDDAFFYWNLQENVHTRIAAYLAAH